MEMIYTSIVSIQEQIEIFRRQKEISTGMGSLKIWRVFCVYNTIRLMNQELLILGCNALKSEYRNTSISLKFTILYVT